MNEINLNHTAEIQITTCFKSQSGKYLHRCSLQEVIKNYQYKQAYVVVRKTFMRDNIFPKLTIKLTK